MAKWKSEAGQTLVIVAIGMVVLLGFLGLGIDMGYLRYMKRQMQSAADAAAIAGAMETSYCAGTAGCSALTTAAQDALTENGLTNISTSTSCTPTPTVGSTIIVVNNPPSCLPKGSATGQDPHYGDSNYVEVLVAQNEPTFFAKIFGTKSVTIRTRAEAQGSLNCIYSLDPSGTGLYQLFGVVNAACGIIVESNKSGGFLSGALNCILLTLTAPYIGVVGGDSWFCIGTPPHTGISMPNPSDPLAYLTKPTVSSCGTTTSSPYSGSPKGLSFGSSSTVTLNPGTYCGGINIGFGAHVTFGSGTFILTTKNPANGATISPNYGFTVDLGTTVAGSGVTIYNYGPSANGSGSGLNNSNSGIVFNFSSFTSGGVQLVAPTSGTYRGILFFQDPGNTAGATLIGLTNYNTKLQGTYYFPNASVTFALSDLSAYNALVAKDITFGFTASQFNTSSFYTNYQSIPGGSPLRQGTAVLVE